MNGIFVNWFNNNIEDTFHDVEIFTFSEGGGEGKGWGVWGLVGENEGLD